MSCGKVTGDITCVLLYTSGTTGKSKGVVQTHEQLLSIRGANQHDSWTHDDYLLSYLPMAWVGDFMISGKVWEQVLVSTVLKVRDNAS